jgi:hypothetical protein
MVTGRSGKSIATAASAGLFAAAALLAKKLWFLLFLPFIALWKWMARPRS